MRIRSLLRRRWPDLLCIALLLAWALVFCLQVPNYITKGYYSGTDSTIFQTIGRAMVHGKVPYRDVFDHKGITIFLINALAWAISRSHGLWLVELCNLSVALIFAYLACRKVSSAVPSLIAVLCSFYYMFSFWNDFGNYTEEYALSFCCFSLWIFVDYFSGIPVSRWKLILVGVCFAAVFQLRANLICLWLGYVAFIFFDLLFRKDWAYLSRCVLYFLVGFALFMVPVLIYLGINHAIGDWWFQSITYNLMYSSSSEPGAILSYSSESIPLFRIIFILLAGSLAAALFQPKLRKLLSANLLYGAVVFISLLLASRPYPHYLLVAIPVPLLAIACGLDTIPCLIRSAGSLRNSRLWLRLLPGTVIVLLLVPAALDYPSRLADAYSYRSSEIRYHSAEKFVYNAIMDNEATRTDGRTPTMCSLGIRCWPYVALDMDCPSKYISQESAFLIPGLEEEFLAELEAAPPTYLITHNTISDEIQNFIEEHSYTNLWDDEGRDYHVFYLPANE